MISYIKMHRGIVVNFRRNTFLTKKIIKNWEKTASWQMSKKDRDKIKKKTWISHKEDNVKKK